MTGYHAAHLPEDPARLNIPVEPGQRREGIELVFLREAWKDAS